MNLRFFRGIQFGAHDHVPSCAAWMEDWSAPFYALNFAAAGRIRWRMGAGRFLSLTAPVAWWTWPHARFTYGRYPGETWDHYYVTYTGPRAARWFDEGLIPGRICPHRPVRVPERFCERFERLLAALDGKDDGVEPVHCLESLWVLLHSASRSPPAGDSVEGRIGTVADRLRETPSRKWNCRAEARSLAISPVHFRRLFRQQHGLPFHRFVLRARLDQASRLLHDTRLPLKAIAERTGFPDPFHFSHLFRRRYGMPPGAYRRETARLNR